MFDIKWIRDNPEEFDAGLKKRGLGPLSAEAVAIDQKRRAAITELQDLQSRRNEASKAIGAAKKTGDNAEPLIAEMADIKDSMKALEDAVRGAEAETEHLLAAIPNLPFADVPVGVDEDSNIELEVFGKQRKFNFQPKQHFDLGEDLGLMDFEAAARLSGSRFVVLKGALARLEMALGIFMLDVHVNEGGYTEISPPLLVKESTAFGTGNLPKFADEAFQTTGGMWLIPTAEMALTNLVREQILDAAVLPLRYTALTPSFRSEAGAAGKDTRGMFRQHQFSKVELVAITTPEESAAEQERMLLQAQKILEQLDLAFRTVLLSTGDMSFSAHKTIDLEVWLPGQDNYREISSVSNCGDFQARRMDARYRLPGGKGTGYVHTLNGSGLAVGRTMIAVLENYQEKDGSIVVPEVLRPYMGGLEVISNPEK